MSDLGQHFGAGLGTDGDGWQAEEDKGERGMRGRWADGAFSLAFQLWRTGRYDPALADSTVGWEGNELCKEQTGLDLSQTQSHTGCCSA